MGASQDANFEIAEKLSTGLFPHQVDGITFLLKRRRAILADDMGLGKTRQAIIAMRTSEPEGPYLVVCPASVKQNWKREIHLVAPDAEVTILEGKSAPIEETTLRTKESWVIINYDVLAKHKGWLPALPWAGFVLDEAHYLKNHTSQRSNMARTLIDTSAKNSKQGPVVIALTGTPLTNRPRDLFPLLQLMNHSLARSFLTFAKRYCAAEQNEYGWVTDGASNLDELAEIMKTVMIRRNKEEVLNLPPKIRTWMPVELEKPVGMSEMFNVISILMGNAGGSGRQEVNADGTSTRQSGDRTRLLGELSKLRAKLAKAKVKFTKDLVDGMVEQGEKVIIFSCYDEPVQELKKHFGDSAVVITGATPANKRQGIVDAFQTDDSVRVLIANIIAGGIGLNLTAARQVVFNDLDWVPANHWQAEDRAYRIGQTQTVNVTYITASETVDDFVVQVLEVKSALVDAVIEGKSDGDIVSRDILSELEAMIKKISPNMADYNFHEKGDPASVRRLLAKLIDEQKLSNADIIKQTKEKNGPAPDSLVSREALMALAAALSGPSDKTYRIESSSKKGEFYDVTVVGNGEVVCSCPGFSYRGTCKHFTEVSAAVRAGKDVPAHYWQVNFDE